MISFPINGERKDIHIVAGTIGDELEDLAKLERILAAIDLQICELGILYTDRTSKGTYNEQAGHTNNQARLGGRRGLSVESGDLVYNTLKR
jgi:hypothetical protein